MFADKIHSLGCDLSDRRLQNILKKITELKSLAFPVVCLPDILLKPRVEAPASMAVATKNTIIPELTAPSVGCGMGIAKTSLQRHEVDEKFFEQFYKNMRRHLGARYGIGRNLLLWLGLTKRKKQKYDLTEEEFTRVIREGASAVLEKYGFGSELLHAIEYKGSLFTDSEKHSLKLHDILPRVSFKNGMHDLGYGFKGNHFLEIQYVEEILDPAIANQWNIKMDQVIIMFHGGGGVIPYHVGRYYGNRKKNTAKEKAILTIFKILFHFGSWEGIKHFRERFRFYILPRQFAEIPSDSEEGKRLLTALKAALNYSYAFRVAMLRRINDSIRDVKEGSVPKAELIWDTIHNSILPETIRDKDVIVHRHTATRVFPGKPVIVSGFNTTSSYLAIGLKDAEGNLFSADHGAGGVIKKLEAEGVSRPHPKNHKTMIYQTKEPSRREVNHITDEGLEHVMEHLKREGIASPVIRLRPLAVFKG